MGHIGAGYRCNPTTLLLIIQIFRQLKWDIFYCNLHRKALALPPNIGGGVSQKFEI